MFAGADLIVKVKEPIAAEYHRFREGQQLFTYLHLAADKALTEFLLERKIDSIAYETVQTADRKLPLLTPMSEVAGRMSVQAAAHALESPAGGAGILLGGVPGTPAAKVTIIGGGVSGTEAAKIAIGMRAIVRVLDTNPSRLAYLSDVFGGRLDLVIPNRAITAASVADSDVVIGAVLVPGAKAPKLVTREMIKSMRPGSVVVDIAIDQGGCFETSRPTTHSDPTYVEEGVVHYCVANIPGAVARTSTMALTAATLPYLVRVAAHGVTAAAAGDPALAKGLSSLGGELVNEAGRRGARHSLPGSGHAADGLSAHAWWKSRTVDPNRWGQPFSTPGGTERYVVASARSRTRTCSRGASSPAARAITTAPSHAARSSVAKPRTSFLDIPPADRTSASRACQRSNTIAASWSRPASSPDTTTARREQPAPKSVAVSSLDHSPTKPSTTSGADNPSNASSAAMAWSPWRSMASATSSRFPPGKWW